MDVCIDCADTAMKLRPGQGLCRLVEIKNMDSKTAAASEDPKFPAEYDHAMKIKSGEIDRPELCPANQISLQGCYGFRVSQEYGALTEDEYKRLVERNPATLPTLKPIQVPWQGPHANLSKLYLVSLEGLPLDIALAMRKITLYYDNSALNDEVYLSPETQFNANQAEFVWKHIFDRSKTSRPDQLRPGADGPCSLEELQQKHDKIDEEKRAKLHDKQAVAAAFIESEDPKEEVEGVGSVGMGAGSLAGKASSKKPVRRTQKSSRGELQAKLDQKLNPPTPVASSGVPAIEDVEVASSAKKSIKFNSNNELQELDEELRKVAEKHLASNPGSSVKSLKGLVPENFIIWPNDVTDQEGLRNLQRSQGSIISGVQA